MEVLEQTENLQDQKYPYAGFWWRLLAYVIDDVIIDFVILILFMPIYILMFGFYGFSSNRFDNLDREFDNAGEIFEVLGPIFVFIPLMVMASIFVYWLYFALMESSRHQGTIGKILLGLKVTDLHGNRITFARASGRFFGKILSGLIFMIGYIMAGFTEKKQALHDILADCLVIKIK